MFDVEDRYRATQRPRPSFQQFHRGHNLLDQRGALLRHLVRPCDDPAGLLDAAALPFRCSADLTHDVGYVTHDHDHFIDHRAGFNHQG